MKKNLNWTPIEENFLMECCSELGMSEGIKRFLIEYPSRSYNSCYSKYKRILEKYKDYDLVVKVSDNKEIINTHDSDQTNNNWFTRFKNWLKTIFYGCS